MVLPKWLPTLFVTVFLAGQGTVAQFQLDLNDPGIFVYGLLDRP